MSLHRCGVSQCSSTSPTHAPNLTLPRQADSLPTNLPGTVTDAATALLCPNDDCSEAATLAVFFADDDAGEHVTYMYNFATGTWAQPVTSEQLTLNYIGSATTSIGDVAYIAGGGIKQASINPKGESR